MEIKGILESEIELEEYLVQEYLLGVFLIMNLSLRFPQLVVEGLSVKSSFPRSHIGSCNP